MAKIVVTNLNPKKPKMSAASLKKRRITADGKQQTVYLIETDRPDVGDQLRTVFQLNVNRARRKTFKPHAVAAE
jgi:hypothetical protein